LVEAAGRDAVSARFNLQEHLDKPERLAGLIERARTLSRNTGAVFTDFYKGLSLSAIDINEESK
jgi:hypothetical protein